MLASAAPTLALTFVLSLAGAWIVLRLSRPRRPQPAAADDPGTTTAVLLFRGDNLLDASPASADLLRIAPGSAGDLPAVLAILARQFPGLSDRLARKEAEFRLLSADGLSALEVQVWEGHTRLVLRSGAEAGAATGARLLEGELAMLRGIAEDSPQLIWKEDANGAVVWANRAYLGLADAVDPAATCLWPGKSLFPSAGAVPGAARPSVRRASLAVPPDGPSRWFEITSVRRDDETLCFGVEITALVAAEAARSSVIQTMSKAFAHLPDGLAIFDRARRLSLFNPAFVDLTGLPVAFLSSRPLVQTLLDRLRDNQMLPEPRNYRSWREQVAALESEAEQGTYCETWSLPGGQTYRVTGRPHPDGALAFVFEDISDEIALTRHFRAEQETTQAVLDALPEAIAVFSAGGTLVLCNAGYADLWGSEPGRLQGCTLESEFQRWSQRLAPSPALAELSVALSGAPAERSVECGLLLRDGRILRLETRPLPRGATMLTFRPGTGVPVVAAASIESAA